MTFRVGQKVVCVDASGQRTFLRKGEIYTVCSISPCGRYVRINTSNRSGHYRSRFRPLIERKAETDISVFKKMLIPAKEDACTGS